jgi:hypothetical protein
VDIRLTSPAPVVTSALMTSLAFSLIMYTAVTMKKPAIRGKTDASTTQVSGPVHAKVGVHYGHLVILRSRLAPARRVVAPGLVPDELPYLLPGISALSRHQLPFNDLARAAHHAPYELHAFYDGLQVVSARVVAVIEVTEIDVRHVPVVVRSERHLAGPPLLEARVRPFARTQRFECAVREERKVRFHLVNHAHLVAILQILADPGEIHTHVNAKVGQLFARPPPRKA